jgi:predicted amidophosphoribosyltransferase
MSAAVDQKKCIALVLAKTNEEGILDDFSRMVLRLKNYADPSTLEFFFELLHPRLEKGLPIVSVPSSTAGKINSGITRLAKMLSNPGCGRIDATSCLVRTVSVKPNHMRGERSIAKHLNSIEVVNRHLIQGQTVILLDDICSTGSTLDACDQLLMGAGAVEIKQYALLIEASAVGVKQYELLMEVGEDEELFF